VRGAKAMCQCQCRVQQQRQLQRLRGYYGLSVAGRKTYAKSTIMQEAKLGCFTPFLLPTSTLPATMAGRRTLRHDNARATERVGTHAPLADIRLPRKGSMQVSRCDRYADQ
jgi:hypothetical protein